MPGGTEPPNPLAWNYPSPTLLLHYPLFATNVKILCETDGWKTPRGQSSLMTTIASLRLTYLTEGPLGLYRGGHLYLLHQVSREGLRLLSDRCFRVVEPRLRQLWQVKTNQGQAVQNEPQVSVEDRNVCSASEAVALAERVANRWLWWARTLTKYLIDVAVYPMLLASTRVIILRTDPQGSWDRLRLWCREEGNLSVFNGLTSSLVSSAFDEIMDFALSTCIDRYSSGPDLELADKMLLKASASSVVSVFTSPVNYIGIIQRCQSSIPGLIPQGPVWRTLQNLPWKGSFFQFFLFSSILAMNVKLIQWKLEVQAEEDLDYSRSE